MRVRLYRVKRFRGTVCLGQAGWSSYILSVDLKVSQESLNGYCPKDITEEIETKLDTGLVKVFRGCHTIFLGID